MRILLVFVLCACTSAVPQVDVDAVSPAQVREMLNTIRTLRQMNQTQYEQLQVINYMVGCT